MISADGKRRERIAGTDYTWYNWDVGFTVVSEEDNVGALSRTYVGQGGPSSAPSAGRLNANVPVVLAPVRTILADVAGSNPATGSYRHYTQDSLGSTRGAYDSTKVSLGESEYTPYGEEYADTLPTDISRRYTGLDLDTATGKYFSPYRYYDPAQARWNTRDPLGTVDGPNVYTYVIGNVINLIDLLGLEGCPPKKKKCEEEREAVREAFEASLGPMNACVGAYLAAMAICLAFRLAPTFPGGVACIGAGLTMALACGISLYYSKRLRSAQNKLDACLDKYK